MKYLIGLALTLIFGSCDNTRVSHLQEVERSDLSAYSVSTIDGCEYVIYKEGVGNFATFGMAHKGNCKNHPRTTYNK